MHKHGGITNDMLANDANNINYENCQSEYICDEIKIDTKKSRPYFENAWILDPDCKNNKSIENLFTVIIINKNVSLTQKIISHIKHGYQQLQIIVGLTNISEIAYNDKKISMIKLNASTTIHENKNWIQLIQHVKTEYVFIGYKLRKWHKSNNFGHFERMLRLLHSSEWAKTGKIVFWNLLCNFIKFL